MNVDDGRQNAVTNEDDTGHMDVLAVGREQNRSKARRRDHNGPET